MTTTELVQLAARVGEAIEDTEDVRLATGMLEDAWAWVRHYGDPAWDPELPETPDIAKTIALNAASRGYQNPGGFDDEKSDAVSLGRQSAFSKLTHPAAWEIDALKQAANKRAPSLSSLPVRNSNIYQSRWDVFRDPPKLETPLMIGNPNHGVMWTGVY